MSTPFPAVLPRLSDLPRLLSAVFLGFGLGVGLVTVSAEVAAEEEAGSSTSVPSAPSASDEASPGSEEDASDSAAKTRFPPPPAGVRFGEALEGNRLRLAYSWERTKDQGLLAGDQRISTEASLALGFTRVPRRLEVTVHTFQVAYAPHPRVTLVAEVPFFEKELETKDSVFGRSQNQTDGVGDISLTMVVPFIRKGGESTQVHIGFDAPSGAYRRGGDMMRLAYDSQIGNGTWDFEWGWTYLGHHDRISWGGQAIGRHPIQRNGVKYRTGSRFSGTVWGAVQVVGGLAVSVRADWTKQNNIEGFDRTLRPFVDPAENPKVRGGHRITMSPGMSFDLPQLKGQRISVEAGIPVYQDLDGPQLERDWSIKTAWQWVY